ncbi:MAG: hypothetical protein ACOCXS_03885 [Bacteroidota bacterium]
MLRNYLTSIVFILLLLGMATSSCSTIFQSSGASRADKRAIEKRKKPKVIQLDPLECPWDKTYRIKNAPDRKEYGRDYAKKQNKKL